VPVTEPADRAGQAAGQEQDDEHEQRPEQEQRLRQRDPQHSGERGDVRRRGEDRQPLVESV